jgi:hypothetical protein
MLFLLRQVGWQSAPLFGEREAVRSLPRSIRTRLRKVACFAVCLHPDPRTARRPTAPRPPSRCVTERFRQPPVNRRHLTAHLAKDAAGWRLLPSAHLDSGGAVSPRIVKGAGLDVMAVDAHAAILKQAGQHPMRDGDAHLALDVIADDWNASLLKATSSIRVLSDEHWECD